MNIMPIDLERDLNKLEALAKAAFGDTPDSNIEQWFSFSEMSKYIKSSRGCGLKTANENGKISGFIYAQQENPINGQEGVEKWVIVMAAVDPAEAGRGVGTALLGAIEDYAASRDATKMFVYTNKEDDQVIHFYRKNGYEDAGLIKDYQYGKGNSAVFLLKNLRTQS